jgi:tryptophanyl-tRNA synthetase
MAFKVTPWETSGDINYDKLITQFGLTPLNDLPEVFNENVLFRRKKIFAHRDYGRIMSAMHKKQKFAMMTGLMPTGKFHIGHAILAKQFLFYQKMGAKIYICVADIEAYHARGQSLEDSRKIALEEYIPNYIALGLKKENVEIYFQSNRSKNVKKSNAFYRLQNILARYLTFNEFKASYGDVTPGKVMAGLLQAADMLHPMLEEFSGNVPVVVPVGTDQDPHIRLARDIVKRLKKPKFQQLCSTYHVFVPGLNGGKMSSSNEKSYIALTDDAKTVKNKVNRYALSGGRETLEEHRKLGGIPEKDIPYQWLTFFEEDDKKLKQIYDNYKSGKLLTGELKQILIEKLNSFLKDHQKKLIEAKKVLKNYIDE